ncbi:MAG: MFS transporter [Candidatus Hermodarchaeota archaeon]
MNEEETSIFAEKGKFSIVIMPLTFIWLMTTFCILIYIFDLIDFVKANNLMIIDNDFIILSIWAVPAGFSCFIGIVIDHYPRLLRSIATYSFLGCSLSLLLNMIALGISNVFLMIITLASMGFFTGVLAISGQTIYGLIVNEKDRGKTYAIVIFLFAGISVGLILITGLLGFDFFFPLILVALMGISLSIVFHFLSEKVDLTLDLEKQDIWPTRLVQILIRPSVISYFWSHTLIWIMFGLMIGSLAQVGRDLNYTGFFGIEIGDYKAFWIIILLGSFATVLISGYLTDTWGRKTSIIIATYGIVFASLLVGILPLEFSFILSTLIIGASFALINSSLDSSLWIDLASKDSLGRYVTLGFESFGLGFIIGFIISYWFYIPLYPEILEYNVFILIGLAVLASLPLFWISDSFPPLEFFLLLIIDQAGIPIFNYDFRRGKALHVDLPLISGALSAVGSFMLEATGEKDARLDLVRHGSNFILTDSNEIGLSAAIFANKNDIELQRLLKKFLNIFVQKYKDVLPQWDGNVRIFDDAINDAEEVFGPLIAIISK